MSYSGPGYGTRPPHTQPPAGGYVPPQPGSFPAGGQPPMTAPPGGSFSGAPPPVAPSNWGTPGAPPAHQGNQALLGAAPPGAGQGFGQPPPVPGSLRSVSTAPPAGTPAQPQQSYPPPVQNTPPGPQSVSAGHSPQPPKAQPSVQFYSLGAGGVASPSGPPTTGGPPVGVTMRMPPPPTGVPDGSEPGLARQMSGLSLGSGSIGGPPGPPMPGYPGGPGQMGSIPQGPPSGPPPVPIPGDWGSSQSHMGGGEPMPAMPPIEIDPISQCDPRIMQLTVGCILNSATQAQSTKIPIALVCSPMALDDHPEGELDLVNFGTQGIMRCKRCRTYINPFVSWIENGRRWRCNVCGMVNEVPTSYFCHLDADGQRRDKLQRPELCKGSVEFVAPGEYMVRPPQPPVYVFVLDVSTAAVQSGLLACTVAIIKKNLKNMPGNPRTQVGFVTYDSTVHFYNLKSTLKQPQCYVVSELDDVFLPCPDDLLVNLSESREVIEALLDSLPQMYITTNNAETVMGPALMAAYRMMSHVGGKMVVVAGNLPSTGEGKLKHRENPRLLGTDQEHKMLNAEDGWYKSKSVEFSRLQISVDLFVASHQYSDLSTLQELPKYTAGRSFFYPSFNRLRDGDKLEFELGRTLTQTIVFEAVMRVRATRGLRITNFYGNYFIRGSDLLALPNCTPENTYAIEFAYEEQLLVSSVMCIQAALLYTSSTGERRIRVHNLAMPVSTVIQDFINSINIDVLCNLMAKQALEIALKTGLDFARNRIFQNAADIIRSNRGGGSMYGAPAAQQSQMPESLQLLPLYSMALQKNVALRGGVEVRTDERAFFMMLLANMNVDASRCFIYPRMFSLHNMPEEAGHPCHTDASDSAIATAGSQRIVLPPVVNLSAERLESSGIFLLEDAFALHIWVGRASNPSILMALFGVPSIDRIDPTTMTLTELENDLSKRVMTIANALREERHRYLQAYIIREGETAFESRFLWHLVEDRATFPGGSFNYPEYMTHITRQTHGVG